jgi:hypothetical protein
MHIVNDMKRSSNIVKKWLILHEAKIVIIIVLLAVAGISYVFGFFHGIELSPQPLIISQQNNDPIIQAPEDCMKEGESVITVEDCRFVGSIKGKKYYPPTCSAAQQIAKENLRCFTSEQDAAEKGYEISSSCN